MIDIGIRGQYWVSSSHKVDTGRLGVVGKSMIVLRSMVETADLIHDDPALACKSFYSIATTVFTRSASKPPPVELR